MRFRPRPPCQPEFSDLPTALPKLCRLCHSTEQPRFSREIGSSASFCDDRPSARHPCTMEYSINYAKKSHLYKTGKYGWALTIELPNRVCYSVLSSWVEIKTITTGEVKTSAQLSGKSSSLLQCYFPMKYSFLYTIHMKLFSEIDLSCNMVCAP